MASYQIAGALDPIRHIAFPEPSNRLRATSQNSQNRTIFKAYCCFAGQIPPKRAFRGSNGNVFPARMAIPAPVWEIRSDGRIPAFAGTAAKMLGEPITDIAAKRMLKGTILDFRIGNQLHVVATLAAKTSRPQAV